MEDFASLLDGIGTLLWPLVAIGVLVVLWPTLRNIIRTRPFTIKIGAFELSAQDASDELANQIADLQDQVNALKAVPPGSPAPPVPMPGSGSLVGSKPGPPARVLWVDDKPENNAYEIARLTQSGVEVATATSTRDGLEQLRTSGPFDALITDLGRREGLRYSGTAGFDTLRQARAAGFAGLGVVYTSRDSVQEHGAEARAAGEAITASPTELYRLLDLPSVS